MKLQKILLFAEKRGKMALFRRFQGIISTLLLEVSLLQFPFCLELTHSPLKILPNSKTRFEASRAVFWSLSRYKELKLTIKPFTGRSLRGLLIQMQNISLRSSGMRRKQNFEISLYFLLTSFFAFLASFFFLLLGI